MTIKVNELGETGLEINIEGKPKRDEFKNLPEVERHVDENGQVGLLIDVTGINEPPASDSGENLNLAVKHYYDVRRLAVVSKSSAKPDNDWLADLARPFTAARVRYYTENDIDLARRWIRDTPKT